MGMGRLSCSWSTTSRWHAALRTPSSVLGTEGLLLAAAGERSPSVSSRSSMARAKVIAALLALAALASFIALDLYHSTFSRQGLRWLLELSFPPSGSVLGIALRGLWETMHIAYLGTLLWLSGSPPPPPPPRPQPL